MIPKTYKLKLRKMVDFFQNCKRYYSKYFLVFHQVSDEENVKIVVVVPKKIVKLRVGRTKIKRQIYNLSLPLLIGKKGLNMVLVINKKIVTAQKQQILDDLNDIFFKLSSTKND